jgi:L-fuconolactonase
VSSPARSTIDAHFHLWQVGDSDLAWVTPEWQMLRRDYLLPQLEAAFDSAGVSVGVYVESGQTTHETAAMQRRAAESDRIAAFIPWVDLAAADAEAELDRLQRDPKFRGVRVNTVESPDGDALSQPAILRGLCMLADRGLTHDFGVRTRHLLSIARVYEKHPHLRGVIDHMGLPDMASGSEDAEWRSSMRVLAQIPNLFCKISELLLTAGPNWSVEQVRPYVQFVAEAFGPQRIMWASNWPLALLGTDYRATFDLAQAALGPVSPRERSAFLTDNAEEFYGLTRSADRLRPSG